MFEIEIESEIFGPRTVISGTNFPVTEQHTGYIKSRARVRIYAQIKLITVGLVLIKFFYDSQS